MPSVININLIPVEQQKTELSANDAASVTNGLDEKTPDYFKNEAIKHIEALRAPRKTILELQSSLELIMKQYAFDKSYMDIAAEWYAKTAWWYEKTAIVLLISSSGALVGLTIGAAMAPVFAILVIGLYYATTWLLMDHYNTTSRRDKRMSEHFSQREKAMTDSLALLESAEKQVENIIIALCELNIKSADKLKSFEEKIAALNIHTATYLETVHKLEQATDSIVRDNEIIASQLQSASLEIEKSRDDIEQEPTALCSVIHSLEGNNAALSETNDDFVNVSKKMHSNVTSIATLVIGFQEQLTVLQKRVAKDEQASDKLHASMDEALDSNINTDELITESDDAILNAELALHEFNKYLADCNPRVHNDKFIHRIQKMPSFEIREPNRFSMSS